MSAVRSQPGALRARMHLGRAPAGRHLGPVPVTALVAWEVGVVLALIGFGQGGVWRVAGAAVVLGLVATTLVPWNGRVLWRWAPIWWSYRRRNAAARAVPRDAALGPLREWLPELTLGSVPGRRGAPDSGVAFDGSAYVVVLGPDHEELVPSSNPGAIPVDVLARVGEVEGVRLESVQLVVRSVAAPSPTVAAGAGALADSYHEVNPAGVPAQVAWWVALRLRPAEPDVGLAIDDLDGDHPEAVREGLRKAVGWATKVLSSSGLPCRALGEAELRDVLALTVMPSGASGDTRPQGRGSRGRRTSETWHTWTCDDATHVAAWLRDWPKPGLPGLSSALPLLAGLPCLATTTALTLSWTPERELRCSAFVRVCDRTPSDARSAAKRLRGRLRRIGFDVVALDGEQLPGLVATVPLGGGAG